ncbi:hypothetical protein K8B33_01150 [Alcanivorax sp. JB21]|uniref:SO2930 family diheme c-type cytochrome n=1 Tax=Alcanivorax limicola TaxID=2874102 RepID=UPI001CC01116|nr:SO2930 family diheme c-type cytochrome [Alcanivorax limicola]MBZ2187691.1 hypothetical protein [Alcanivorax limicola]
MWWRPLVGNGWALLAAAVLAACGGDGRSGAESSLCAAEGEGVNWSALAQENCPRLSDYRLLDELGESRAPALGFTPSVALFTDYARKTRAIYLPPGGQMQFDDTAPFAFPDGSVLLKTFSLPTTTTDTAPHTRVETRLLILRAGRWYGLPYVWREDGTDADLRMGGALLPRQILRDAVQVDFMYRVPDAGQCALCHQQQDPGGNGRALLPVGLRARYLNHPGPAPSSTNQLRHWAEQGLLQGVPDALGDIMSVPVASADSTTLAQRARGYLDINCRHCHVDQGSGGLSGLRLGYEEDPGSLRYGVCKQPPGYDGGAAGLDYDIVPGDGAASILPYRMAHTAARDRMPPLGRSLVHEEAVAMVRAWIDSMPPVSCD